jgi:hypothetical protein
VGDGGEMAQIMYTHVSKCKNDKLKLKIKKKLRTLVFNFCEKRHWNFDKDYFGYINQFEYFRHFYNINSSDL